MSNPHIDLALVLLQQRRAQQHADILRMQRQIGRYGNGLRLMGDDRTLNEHLSDVGCALADTIAAITYLESLS